MIYLVIGEEYDYDYSHHENFYASVSREKAENKLQELLAAQVTRNKCAEELRSWIKKNPCDYNDFDKYQIYKAQLDAFEIELAAKYSCDVESVRHKNNLNYSIEEVPSDDDD